jgi:hypothetical protein
LDAHFVTPAGRKSSCAEFFVRHEALQMYYFTTPSLEQLTTVGNSLKTSCEVVNVAFWQKLIARPTLALGRRRPFFVVQQGHQIRFFQKTP